MRMDEFMDALQSKLDILQPNYPDNAESILEVLYEPEGNYIEELERVGALDWLFMYLYFIDNVNKRWKFNFIYYNNKFFGGTRNEYRLTGMTAYIRQNNLKTGDTIVLSRDDAGILSIRCERQNSTASNTPKLVITGTWKVVNY